MTQHKSKMLEDELIITDEFIRHKNSHPKSAVMHISESGLMKKHSQIVTQNGGHILEIGFGMGLSATSIQSNPNVKSHTIIEIHPQIYERALKWSSDKPNVEIIFGNWIDILPTLNKKFDGVFHDTHLDPNIPKFLDYVKHLCKKDTIVSFFEYREQTDIFDYEVFEINEDDLNSLPYKESLKWYKNYLPVKYTTFDGNNFISKYRKKTII